MTRDNQLGAGIAAGVVGAAASAYGAYALFVTIPAQTGLQWWMVGIISTTAGATALLAGVLGYELAGPGDPVAEIAVEDAIRRDTAPSVIGTSTPDADDIAEAIDDADADDDVEALLVTFNTPGGEITPSEDIARAVESFDGPTVGYARDLCASGGYHIASACDYLVARENALVGSIGVKGSRPNLSELADDLGIAYEELTAGEYKEAGAPLKEMEHDERQYLQSMIDGVYDAFVETVADRRGLDEQAIRDTEARVYRGAEAVDIGLVDATGTRADVEDWLDERVGDWTDEAALTVADRTPSRSPFAARLGLGSVAYAFGAGIASQLTALKDAEFSLEYKR